MSAGPTDQSVPAAHEQRQTKTGDDVSLENAPQLDASKWQSIDTARLFDAERSSHAPRILMLYGSLREKSYSRLLTEEAARVLNHFGAETRLFDPDGLPQPDTVSEDDEEA